MKLYLGVDDPYKLHEDLMGRCCCTTKAHDQKQFWYMKILDALDVLSRIKIEYLGTYARCQRKKVYV